MKKSLKYIKTAVYIVVIVFTILWYSIPSYGGWMYEHDDLVSLLHNIAFIVIMISMIVCIIVTLFGKNMKKVNNISVIMIIIAIISTVVLNVIANNIHDNDTKNGLVVDQWSNVDGDE